MAKRTHHLSFITKHACVEITEHLRYAGIVSLRGAGHTGYVPLLVQNELNPKGEDIIITCKCPHEYDPSAWSKMNIARMRSFGVKAVHWTESR